MRYSSQGVLAPGTQPKDKCEACGHWALHHDYYDAPTFHHTIACNWRGCGCPAFVSPAQIAAADPVVFRGRGSTNDVPR